MRELGTRRVGACRQLVDGRDLDEIVHVQEMAHRFEFVAHDVVDRARVIDDGRVDRRGLAIFERRLRARAARRRARCLGGLLGVLVSMTGNGIFGLFAGGLLVGGEVLFKRLRPKRAESEE